MRIPETGEFPRCLLNTENTVLRIGIELLSHCPLVRSSVFLPAGVNIASIYLSRRMNHIVFSHNGEESGGILSPHNTLMTI